MEKETKKILIRTFMYVLVFLLILGGTTYAYMSFSISGKNDSVITAACLKLELTDENGINLTSTVPMSDEVGLTQTPYTFTISNKCTIDMNYMVLLNVLNTSNTDNLSKVKIAFSGAYSSSPVLINTLTPWSDTSIVPSNVSGSYLATSGALLVGETKTFNVNMWIDIDVTTFVGSLQSKVMVYAIQTT